MALKANGFTPSLRGVPQNKATLKPITPILP